MTTSSKTNPPPPPPKFGTVPRPKPVAAEQQVRDVGGYKLPMASKYVPKWKAILSDLGLPTDVVVLDFETYFADDYSLRLTEWSTIEFIMADQFEVLGCSCLDMHAPFLDYEQSTRWWSDRPGEGLGVADMFALLQRKYGPNLERCVVVMQNARFDAAIMAYRYGIHPPHIIDTLGLARHWDSRTKNDLDSIAKREGLPAKGDTLKFKGWTHRRRFLKPKKGRGKKAAGVPAQCPRMTLEEDVQLGNYANNDTAREWEAFTLYLPRLSRPEIEIPLIQHTLDMFLKPELRTDPQKAEELVAGMEARMNEEVEAAGMTPTQLRGRHFDDTVWEWIKEYGPWMEMPCAAFQKEAKCKQGWKLATAGDDWQRDELLVHPDPRVSTAMRAKMAVHSWPNHIKRVRRIIRQCAAAGGKLPVPLKYGGAHTLRWSGDEKINLQNLGERNPEPLIRAVRQLLVAQPGHKLVIADLSAIEGRGTGWIADQQDLLAQFREQDADPEATQDVYTHFASRVLGRAVRKPNKGGIPQVEDRMKWCRNAVGKVGVLGCGYGMGAEKAEGYAGGAIDLATAKKIVQTYRETNDKIVQFWKDIERAFIYTYKYRRPCELPRGLRLDAPDNCDVIVTLPNGHEMKYHKVRLGPGKFGGEAASVWNGAENKWTHVWGGHFTENIVQGFCRDILAEALLRCEAAGIRIVLHVHDELVAHVPTAKAEKALATMITELTRPLPWAPDLPLAAEGLITDRYGGH